MSRSESARVAVRHIRSATILAALVFVSATLIGVVTARVVGRALASSFSAASRKAIAETIILHGAGEDKTLSATRQP